MMENPIKIDDLGYHYFWKHPYSSMLGLGPNLIFNVQFLHENLAVWGQTASLSQLRFQAT